ncbi:transmembrane protein, putative (macronuclear) [Tetrahymena thermophila SB210]|uniref:Transmembrane protein, putative n=1 Tax=Tetrahymena thermophila (strain SB210) TaxID=312017 RepID=I7MEP1_TETTS|nr:transmembrane protein, putative [Tetrahymena thermophila SB210]EAR97291.2 transmembrane protein, putative [Tetrahymena thermophila SB210]|eukprot:XP_001017536.2 transmembrane protein, putative [Tetrahymena thermophila SB210]
MLEGQYISQNLYFQVSNQIKSFTKCTKVFEIKNNYYNFLNQLNTIQSYQNQNNRIILVNLGQGPSPYIYFLLQFNRKEITIFGTQQTVITLENLTKTNDEITPNILINNSILLIRSDQQNICFNQNIQKLSLKNLRVVGESKTNDYGQILDYTQIENSQIQYFYQQYIIIQNCTISSIKISNMQSLFFIKNAYNVIIKRLIIDNCILDEISVLIQIQDADYVQIENLTITNNQFFNISSIFHFENINNLLFKKITIINNYPYSQKPFLQQSQYLTNSYVFYFISTHYLKITNMIAQSNVQLAIVYSQNFIEKLNEIQFQQDDEILFNNLVLEGNLYTSTRADFSFVQIKGSLISFESSRIQSNQCNQCNGTISLYNFININIQQSSFISNIALNGGAFFIKDTSLTYGLNISSSKFTSNVAHLSGGAIYLINSNIIDIILTKFSSNRALIGGAIRQIGAYSDLLFKKQDLLKSNFVIFKDNKGLSYGNDICAYPSKVLTHIKINNLYDIKQCNNKSIYFGNEIQDVKLRSGISIDVKVYFQDQQQQILKINYENLSEQEIQLLDQEYQNTIIYLKQDINDQNGYKIDGGTIISALQSYNFKTQSFDFTNLIFTGTLQKCFKLQIQSLLINQDFLSFLEIGSYDGAFTICFDICKQGQIPILTSINEIVCRVCEEGSYSLYQMPIQYTFESIQKEDFKCQKCPQGSLSCQANEILLLDGYWRSDDQSDKIYTCNYLYNNCVGQSQHSKNYCAEGYLGPLCSSCDIFGEVWESRYILLHDLTCKECQKPYIQIILIIIFVITLLIICFLILRLIKQGIQKNSICQYLRHMKLLPLSHTQIIQRFSIIKCLINFLQISIICNLKDGILPLNVIELFRNPLLFLIYKFDCFYPKDYQPIIVELRVYMIAIFSIFFLVMMLTFHKESRKSLNSKKIHPFIYQILNFIIYLFSPQIIKYLIESITCFEVGDEEYLVVYSLQKCYVNGTGYGLFVNIVVIPSLVLIFLQPLIIFYKIRKQKHILDYLLVKYKYGFHYIEYNSKYYWWDLLRSYFKFVIILATSIIYQQDDFQYFFLLILATIYLNFQSKRKIFVNNYIQKLETISYTILILQFSIQYIQRIYTSYIFILNQIFFMIYLVFILVCLTIILVNIEIKCFLKQKVKIWILIYTVLNKFLSHKYLSLIFINKPRYIKSGLKPLLTWKYLLRQRSVIIQSKIDYLKCSKDKQLKQNISNLQVIQQKQERTNTNRSNDNIFIRKKKALSNSINLESQFQSHQDWKHSINSSQISEHNFDLNKLKIQAVFSQNNSFQHSIFCPSSKIQQKNLVDDELSNFDIQSEKSQKHQINL